MKSNYVLVFAALMLMLYSCDTFACHFKMRSYDYPPFAVKSDDGQWSGPTHDYADALMAAMNCRITIVEAPWARGIDMLKRGEIDMMLEVSKTKDREPYFYFVGPQRMETIYLVTRAGEFQTITSWKQLGHLEAVLMRQKGSYFGERFEQVMKTNPRLRNSLVELSNSEVRMALLRKGRIDGFLIEGVYFNYLKSTDSKASELTKHPLVIHENPIYFAFSKASITPVQLRRIHAAYDKLVGAGTLNEIAQRYRYAEQVKSN